MVDLSSIANPYDFANPVSRRELFFGRKDEMAEIKYYLDHAKTARRAINIALLGLRAAGKTSILNITELEAKSRGFCSVRLDLDENDAAMPLMFFFKLFDGLLAAACEMGAFGGLRGKTYETYLNITNCYEIPEAKQFCPFLFPTQYALAMKGNHPSAPTSDHAFKNDLMLISTEVAKPIILLFDEGNILGQSRVLLEKLRNLFMNTPGYMLIVTGTPELFPVMDEVFSPIVRQFKKISVKGFQSEKETAECIAGPLQVFRIPIEIPEADISEIHQLSTGRPYEIQLICHLLFRRVQQRRATAMRLDLSTLEELRRELERSQDMSGRPIVSALRALATRQLEALGQLTQCNGTATLEQLSALTYLSQGSGTWSKDQLGREFESLRRKGIVDDVNGLISFAGDHFDRLFAKYLAAENKVRLAIQEMPLETALVKNVLTLVQPAADFAYVYGPDIWNETTAAASAFLQSGGPDVFIVFPRVAEELYFQMITEHRLKELSVLYVSLNLPWASTALTIYSRKKDNQSRLEKLRRNLSTIKSRVENLGGSFNMDLRSLPVATADQLSTAVLTTQNEVARLSLARHHTQYAIDSYGSKPTEAARHVHLALAYDAVVTPRQSNNLGYILLRFGELKAAEKLLHDAYDGTDSPFLKALVAYNLAIVNCRKGDRDAAYNYVNECMSLLPQISDEDKNLGWLEEIALDKGSIRTTETRNPRLDLAAARLQQLLKQAMPLGASMQLGSG
jgi:tetratricopeptide (TPR) repeat protein